MTAASRLPALARSVFIVLALSAAWTVPALADEATPPPTETSLPAEETAEGITEDSTAASPSPALISTTESSNEPTEGSEPRASEEQAGTLDFIDPVWCPTGVVPIPLSGGCSADYANLSTLVNSFVPAGNGVIWLESGTDTGVSVGINGNVNWAAAAGFALTLQGGWDGVSGSTFIDPSNPSVFNGDAISIIQWNADVTINDLRVENVAGLGLLVHTTGKITVTRVTARTSSSGANFNNSGGIGSIAVTSSSFSDNDGHGLTVLSAGAVTLTDVVASGNGPVALAYGATISNTSGTSGVTLLGTNVFNDNDDGGLHINSKGPIKIAKLIANGNINGTGAVFGNSASLLAQPVTVTGPLELKANSWGMYIDTNGAVSLTNVNASFNTAYGGQIFNNKTGFSSNVTLAGMSFLEANGWNGLDIVSNGSITLTNIIARFNGQFSSPGVGLNLSNSAATSPKPVTLAGINIFTDNLDTGLAITSKGAITLSGLTASSNGDYGVSLFNGDSGPASPQNVTLTGTNTFDENGIHGLFVQTYGAITASNLHASGNGSAAGHIGIALDNEGGTLPRPVTLTGINVVEQNASNGLLIQSLGAIKISNLTASLNGHVATTGRGAHLDNYNAPSPQPVTLSGTSIFTDNYDDGLLIQSRGPITASSLQASENGNEGVDLNNLFSTSGSPQNVALTGSSSFYANSGSGLFIQTYGAVSLSNLGSYANDIYGALIVSDSGTIPKAVVLSGVSTFSDNQNAGLSIDALGAITVNNITASGNGINVDTAVLLKNDAAGASGAVTVAGTLNQFLDNYYGGLFISSLGSIKLSNVRATGNGVSGTSGDGVGVYNSGSGPLSLSITGINVFSDNYGMGLEAAVTGPITASNLTASGSQTDPGAFLYNGLLGASLPQNVTLTGTNVFEDNYLSGLRILTYGAVSASNLHATDNGFASGSGVWIENSGGAVAKAVTISGSSSFQGNDDHGLEIASFGLITAANLTAVGNGQYGVTLANAGGTAGVTLTGASTFVTSGGSGLNVFSRGPITAANLTAQFNGECGAKLKNHTAAAAQKVTLSGINNLSANAFCGLEVDTKGAVLVNNLTANDNQGNVGADIDNRWGTPAAPQPVTLTGASVFQDNWNDGLFILSHGALTLSSLTALGNGQAGSMGLGINLDNMTSTTTPQKILITGSNLFAGNYDDGLGAWSLGPISISNVTADANGLSGVYLTNNTGGPTSGATVSGASSFTGNAGSGLKVYSFGAISVASVIAGQNGGAGIELHNAFGSSAAGVTITGTNRSDGNTGPGFSILSHGSIATTNLSASDNGMWGLIASNDYASFTSSITIAGVNTFVNNGMDGLLAQSNGPVTVYNVTADGNADNGITITTDGNITVVCGSASGNGDYGIALTSAAGTITLKAVFTGANGIANEAITPYPPVRTMTCP